MISKDLKIKKKKKTAFTLIELLAVIIILGILMIIAVPSVTKYINDSRKEGYISTAREMINGARLFVNSSESFHDKDTTYYIDSECIETQRELKTPYGEFTKAYVVVNYTDEGYEYYWTSVDETGTGIKKITSLDNLNIELLENDLNNTDIPDNLGVDARHNYVVINKENGCTAGSSTEAATRVNTEGNVDIVDYPVGKTKKTLIIGDIVTIGDQEFNFLKNDGDDTILIAHYNLKVGSDYSYYTAIKTYTTSDPGYGLQSSDCLGINEAYSSSTCTLSFSNTNYWHNQIGEGKKYLDYEVYDSNSNLYSYIENYKTYLEGFGINIKEARLLKITDYKYNSIWSVCTTSFWAAKAINFDGSDEYIGVKYSHGGTGLASYSNRSAFGIRPVIVI